MISREKIDYMVSCYRTKKTTYNQLILWIEAQGHKIDFTMLFRVCLMQKVYDIALLLVEQNEKNKTLNINYNDTVSASLGRWFVFKWGFLDYMINSHAKKVNDKNYLKLSVLLLKLVPEESYLTTKERTTWQGGIEDNLFKDEYLKKWEKLHKGK